MASADEKVASVNGVGEEEEEEVEEVEEEIEEEVEVEEEEEEEGGGGAVEEEEAQGKGVDNIDSAEEEMKQAVSDSSSSSGKIFVGGVAWETTKESFMEHFKPYGEITDAVIMKDKHTQKPRGFGFVTFKDPSSIDKVLQDEHVIDGRTVEVKRTVPREDMPSKGGPRTKKIFVGGIPPSLTEDELKEHFSSYGEVVEHQIMLDHSTGRSRGFGFVTFESEEAVEKVISKGKMHDLGGKQVEIKKAEPKKAGGDAGSYGRAGYGAVGANAYGFGVGASGYGAGHRSGGVYYGGRGGGNYGRGYGYGGAPGYGAGFGAGYGAPMYGTGGYGGADGYGGPAGYGAAYGGGYGGGRGYGGRYHPYGR